MTQHHPTLQKIPTNQLTTYHQNPRKGNINTLKQSLKTNRQFRPLVVNKGTHTGRPNEILVGNHTYLAAVSLDGTPDEFPTLDCYVIDVDDQQAQRIVLADNRTSDLATYDNDTLLELLETTDDLDGTGYEEDDLELLQQITADAPTLDELEEEFGTPEDDDYWITVRLRIPPVLNDQWKDWARAYDSPEEAFEALLDKGGEYGEA